MANGNKDREPNGPARAEVLSFEAFCSELQSGSGFQVDEPIEATAPLAESGLDSLQFFELIVAVEELANSEGADEAVALDDVAFGAIHTFGDLYEYYCGLTGSAATGKRGDQRT